MPAQHYLSRGQSFFLLRVQAVISHTPAQTVLRVIQGYAVLSELTAIDRQTALKTCAIYIEPDSECLGKIERRFIHAERVFTAKVIYAAEQAEHGRECGYRIGPILLKATRPKLSSPLFLPLLTAATPTPSDMIKGTVTGPVVTPPASKEIAQKLDGTAVSANANTAV